MRGEGRSMGLKVKIDITIEVVEYEGYSVMKWKANVDIGMLERMLGKENIDKISNDIISKIVACVSSS
jgi:carbon monoxide dehydrogenase subunit G